MSFTEKYIKENQAIAAQQAEVLGAFAKGIATQVRAKGCNEEWRVLEHTDVNLYKYEIRIKPVPKEIWVNIYTNKTPVVHYSEDAAYQGHRRGYDKALIRTEHYLQVSDD